MESRKVEEPGSLGTWLTREWTSPRVSLHQDFMFGEIVLLIQLTENAGDLEVSVLADTDI